MNSIDKAMVIIFVSGIIGLSVVQTAKVITQNCAQVEASK